MHPVTQAISDWRRVTIAYTSDHPAAIGCLLAIVRDLWDDAGAYVQRSPKGGWVACTRNGLFHGPSEGEALLVALKSAPLTSKRP